MDPAVLLGSLRLTLAIAALAVVGHGLAQATGAQEGTERFLRGVLFATLTAVFSVALLGGVGLLNGWTVLTFAIIAALVTWLFYPAQCPVVQAGPPKILWPAFAVVALDVAIFLPVSPTNWDAMTYHLYLPARWLHEGSLFHVPTVFSDNSAAFAPQNGALFFAWQMALLGRDATTNVSQVLCLAFIAVAVYRIARLVDVESEPALLAASMTVFLAPLRIWTYSANVDVFMVAFFLGAVYWLLAAQKNLAQARSHLLCAGLAAGLAAGTKTVALPLAALLGFVAFVLFVRRRQYAGVGLFVAGAAVTGGSWYVKNLVLYDNPLFPMDTRILGLHFPGAYTSATLRGSLFRIEEPLAWVQSVGVQWGFLNWVLILAGLAGLIVARRPSTLGLAGFAVFWGAFDFFVVPHNNQARFLFPVLVVALPGLGLWLNRFQGQARVLIYAVMALAALATSRPDLAWIGNLEVLESAGVGAAVWLALVLVFVATLIALHTQLALRAQRLVGILFLLGLGLLVALASQYSDRGRIAFLAQGDYRAWGAGYLMFNDPVFNDPAFNAQEPPRRIAYNGLNVPYTLMGPGWRHQALYCNTQGAPKDGFYDFWSTDPRVYSTHVPGLYRGDDDFETWWLCLEENRIDTVVLFATIPINRPEHWALSGEFLVERDWIRQRPDLFEPVLATARTEIYNVRPN